VKIVCSCSPLKKLGLLALCTFSRIGRYMSVLFFGCEMKPISRAILCSCGDDICLPPILYQVDIAKSVYV